MISLLEQAIASSHMPQPATKAGQQLTYLATFFTMTQQGAAFGEARITSNGPLTYEGIQDVRARLLERSGYESLTFISFIPLTDESGTNK